MRRTVTGLRAWLVQRVSAVYMLVFVLFALARFAVDPPRSYEAWRNWVLSPAVAVAATVFMAALLAHAWVGIRDVLMDYVHAIAVRVLALSVLALALAGAGTWVIRILWIGHAA